MHDLPDNMLPLSAPPCNKWLITALTHSFTCCLRRVFLQHRRTDAQLSTDRRRASAGSRPARGQDVHKQQATALSAKAVQGVTCRSKPGVCTNKPPSSVQQQTSPSRQDDGSAGGCSRRNALLVSAAAAGGLWAVGDEPAAAVQGITAGRIPGKTEQNVLYMHFEAVHAL